MDTRGSYEQVIRKSNAQGKQKTRPCAENAIAMSQPQADNQILLVIIIAIAGLIIVPPLQTAIAAKLPF